MKRNISGFMSEIEYDEFANLESSLNKKIHTTFQSFCFDRLAGTTSHG
jgi:hypothetical protein